MNESNIGGVSVRGWVCLILVIAFSALSIYLKDASGLKELALIACGYLFGKQQSGGSSAPNQTTSTITSTVASTEPVKS